MSAAELARRTGQKPAALSRRMTGDLAFDLDELEDIASALEIDVLALLYGSSTQITSLIPKQRRTELVA